MFSRDCLYDVRWQVLRCSLLAANNDEGGFVTHSGVDFNLKALSRYINNSPDSIERGIRLWRVLNLCNAVLLGYGSKYPDLKPVITHYRDRRREDLKSCGTIEGSWDWKQVKVDLQDLWKSNKPVFLMVKENLAKRKTRALKSKGTLEHREALAKFLKYMIEVANESL